MINRFSYSRINSFNSCPAKYKIKYIDKNKTDFQSIESFMGIVVHHVLYEQYKNFIDGIDITLDKMLNCYDLTWNQMYHDKLVFSNRIEEEQNFFLYKNGKDSIVRFFNRFINDQIRPLKSMILLEKKIEFEFGNYKFVGIIDRLDINDDQIIIYDYKTSKNRQSKKQLMNSFQFYIYFCAVNKAFNPNMEKKIDISIYNLIHNSIDTFYFTSEKCKEMSNKLNSIMEKIEATTEFIPKKTPLCNWCYYWDECSAQVKGMRNHPFII